jgi:hypothetical protein
MLQKYVKSQKSRRKIIQRRLLELATFSVAKKQHNLEAIPLPLILRIFITRTAHNPFLENC